MANYRNHDRKQIEMKIMCINDFVPDDHQARLIVSIIDSLDLSDFNSYYQNDFGGKAAYPVKSLICILVYAYLNGVYSNRKIETLCLENIVYRYLCCDDPPDHSTISRFWSRFKDEIEKILNQTVYISQKEGLVDFNHVSGDGVRLKSMGSRSKLFNEKTALKAIQQIENTISKLVNKIEDVNQQENKDKLIEKKYTKELLKDRIEKGLQEFKVLKTKVQQEIKRGVRKEDSNYFHITDENAKLIKTKNSGFISGYNAQVLVDSKTNVILTSEVASNVTDNFNGIPLLKKAQKVVWKKNLQKAEISLDNGYLIDDIITFGQKNNFDLYIAAPHKERLTEEEIKKRKPKIKNLLFHNDKNHYTCQLNEIIPFKRYQYIGGKHYAVYERGCNNCSLAKDCIDTKQERKRKTKFRRIMEHDNLADIEKQRNPIYLQMKEKMNKDKSKEIYKKRLSTVEPVFAHIEEHKKFRGFTVWNIEKVKSQWAFVAFVHNLYKIMKYGKRFS